MENQDGAARPRLRIVDTSGPDFRSPDRGKRRRRHARAHHQNQEQRELGFAAQLQQQWPLEAMPIQRAVLEYGRRTAALGAQQGAQALRQLALRIRELGPATPALEQIMLDAESEASRLRTLLDQVYEDD
jgi:hypothetical protein